MRFTVFAIKCVPGARRERMEAARLSRHAFALLPRPAGSQTRALDEIAARQCAADEKRKEEAERQQQAAAVSQTAAVQ
ncbi:MAG: hypothetical protein NTW28_16020 [Candidatus Solibacter sp.]|nr:hypothetical protein [Candidatus Solibacter sp.]